MYFASLSTYEWADECWLQLDAVIRQQQIERVLSAQNGVLPKQITRVLSINGQHIPSHYNLRL
jgi:hypothetical protein